MNYIENKITEHMTSLDPTEVKGTCKIGKVNTRICSKLWPKYPCYNKKLRTCENTDGEILEDPIDNVLYALGETYVATSNAITHFLGNMPDADREQKEEKLLRLFRDNGLGLFALPKSYSMKVFKTLKDIDIPQQIENVSEYLDTTKKYVSKQVGKGYYDKITDPFTNEKYLINSKNGKNILKLYLNYL